MKRGSTMPSAALNVPFRIKFVENDSDVERKNPLAFPCSHFWIAALCRWMPASPGSILPPFSSTFADPVSEPE